MAVGDLTPGRRLPDDSNLYDGGDDAVVMVAGDYCLKDGVVWAIEPNGGEALMKLDGWKTTVHEDGTISLFPSIWVNKHRNPPGWHGYLEHGVWREV